MDDLERAAMHDGSPVRFREKLVARRPALLVAGIGGLLALGGVAQGLLLSDPLAGVLLASAGVGLGGLLAALGVAGGVARTVVTDRAVHVQAGVRFFEIPRDAIREVEVGLRRTAYRGRFDLSVLPVGSPIVAIRYEEDGAPRGLIVSSEDPEALCQALEVRPRVRVAGDSNEEANADADTEADAELEVDSDALERRRGAR